MHPLFVSGLLIGWGLGAMMALTIAACLKSRQVKLVEVNQ